LSQDQLNSVLFPLGEFTKSEVREKAQEIGLTVSDKPESQEICFIPDNDYVAFIKSRYAEHQRPGPIVSTTGEVLGEHQGISSFTIGQRKGLNIAQGYPLYVVSLDKNTNSVVVGRKEEAFRRSLTASRINWIAMETLPYPMALKARIRYRHSEDAARVIPLSPDQVSVDFNQPQLAVTPGQAVVFYDGDIVMGGGWID
jgi:tRNA-specific 2-thiouridylase